MQLEQVGDVLLEAVGPEMRARFRVDELRVDAHAVLVALHRAFEHVANAELLADLLGVDGLALEGEGGVARDDEAVADARKIGGEVFGDAVGEIILGGIVGEVGERQHDDGEMRGLGAACRDGRGSVRARKYQAPPAITMSADDPGEQRRQSRALFRLGGFGLSRRLRLRGDADLQRIGPDRPLRCS